VGRSFAAHLVISSPPFVDISEHLVYPPELPVEPGRLLATRTLFSPACNVALAMQAMIAPQSAKKEGEEAPANELRDFLMGIPLGGEQRKNVIDTLGKEVKMQKETVDFLKLLVDTNRLDCIDQIIATFEESYNQLTDTQVRLQTMLLSFNFVCKCYLAVSV
jgi:hypothetical protein